jgi:hypothetical protein
MNSLIFSLYWTSNGGKTDHSYKISLESNDNRMGNEMTIEVLLGFTMLCLLCFLDYINFNREIGNYFQYSVQKIIANKPII